MGMSPQTSVQQINEKSSRSMGSSSLQVRHSDLHRRHSDETRNLDFPTDCESPTNEVPPVPNATKSNTRLPSSTDGILVSAPTASTSSPIRRHLSPNSNLAEVIPQQIQSSSTSSTPPVSRTSSTEAFRSQRGSVSFDTQNPLLQSTTNKNKPATSHAVFPTCITKPRLRFSLVRDTAVAGRTHNAPIYSMPITRDYSIDEKTNRIVNEFLMHDPTLEESRRNASADLASRAMSKRHHHHHHRIRAKTLEEPAVGQQTNNSTTHLHQTTSTTAVIRLLLSPPSIKHRTWPRRRCDERIVWLPESLHRSSSRVTTVAVNPGHSIDLLSLFSLCTCQCIYLDGSVEMASIGVSGQTYLSTFLLLEDFSVE